MNLWLKSVNNTNVIIGEVPFNRYLNEKKLNYVLRFTCNRFQNAAFADMNYSQSRPYYNHFSLHVTRILLREILHIKYKNDKANYNEKYIKGILRKARETKSFIDSSTQTNLSGEKPVDTDFNNVASESETDNMTAHNNFFRV